jgi:peptide/nickel transport system substrate-binding protein
MRSISLLGGMLATILCVASLCVTSFCMVGPALAQKSGGVLKVYHRDNPPSASILEESTVSTVVPFMPIFNNLVLFDQHEAQNSPDSIRPELARSWRWSADGKDLTFELEQDVRWHDGKPFTAQDVVCTFDLLTGAASQPLLRNPRASWFRNVERVTADGATSVTVHLKRPQPSLLSMLASGLTPIYPCHVSPSQMRRRPIGTGPFKLAQFSEFQYVRLARNTDYWKKGRPYLDGIDFNIVNNPTTAVVSFIAGRFDMTFPWEVTAEDLKTVKRDAPQARCETTSMNLNVNLLVNRTRAPFDNADIRHALVLALDRKEFVDKVTGGDALIGGTLRPPPDGIWGLPADMLSVVPGDGPDVARNRAEARALMEKLGYGPNKPLKVRLSTRGVSLYHDTAVVLRNQLRAIHIDAELETVETSLWYTRLGRKDYTLGLNVTGNGIDEPDQTFYENFACKSSRNYTGYCNPEIEKMFEAQSVERNPAKRREIVHEIDVRLLADGARPPIMWNRSTTCTHPQVKGYTSMVNSFYNGFRFEDVWLDR